MPRALAFPPVIAPELRQSWEARLGDHVVQLGWSPDGEMLAAAQIGGPISVFGSDGRLLLELPGHSIGTLAISWSADSRLLASAGQDGCARIWDAPTGAQLHQLKGGAQWVEHIAFSPSRDYLLTGAGRFLKMWNGSGQHLRDFPDHPSTISGIAWQPRELFFATAAYGQLANYHAEKPEFGKAFAWKGSILVVTWSPDGNYLATGNQDASVHFWYRKSGKDLEMTGYPAKIRELAWDSESRFLATGGSPVVTIWDCGGKGPAGTRPIQLEGHERFLSALAYQHKGRLIASGCQGGAVYVWNHHLPQRPLRGSQLGSAITQIRWAPNDRMLAASTEAGLVRVFEKSEKE
ncbi:MAG: WD40 repeat domain-containing protein [Acidobacteria bacterium]|nr:WD40 repeat domain-containing protein [Acidobacteriota bacterium]